MRRRRALAIDDQFRAGLDRVTDGEMQRVDFNLGFYAYLEGIEPLPRGRLLVPCARPADKYRCVAPIKASRGLGTVGEYQRFRALCDAPAKVPVPGPFTLAGCIAPGDVYRDYRDRKAVTEALIPVVNAELKALEAAGVDFLQLDEPSFACHPDDPGYFLDVIAPTVAGVSTYISMHMCFGNYRARAVGWRSYRPLFPHIGQAGEPARAGVREPGDGRGRAAGEVCPRGWTWPWGSWTSRTRGSSLRSWWPTGCGRCSGTWMPRGIGDARLRVLADGPARRGGEGDGDGGGGADRAEGAGGGVRVRCRSSTVTERWGIAATYLIDAGCVGWPGQLVVPVAKRQEVCAGRSRAAGGAPPGPLVAAPPGQQVVRATQDPSVTVEVGCVQRTDSLQGHQVGAFHALYEGQSTANPRHGRHP